MSKPIPAAPVDGDARVADLLAFYDKRGYRRRIGTGARPAILVIDFSRAFTGGQGEFPGGDFAEQMRQTVRILEAARRKALPVLFTTIAYDDPARESGMWGRKVPWLEHCRAGTALVEIDPALGKKANEELIVKKFPSSFFGTRLEGLLAERNVDTLVITGCTTSVCVRATAIDAMQRGLHALVVAEAVGEFDRNLNAVHLADLDARYADVVSVEDVLRYLESLSRT